MSKKIVQLNEEVIKGQIKEHVLPDQLPVALHHEVQLRHKRRIVPQDMDHVMLASARAVHVPERLAHQVFNGSVVFLRLRADGIILCIHAAIL